MGSVMFAYTRRAFWLTGGQAVPKVGRVVPPNYTQCPPSLAQGRAAPKGPRWSKGRAEVAQQGQGAGVTA